MINGAELNIYFDNGEDATIDLSAMQLKAVLAALGITKVSRTTVKCFSDKGLEKVIDLLQSKIKTEE